MQNPVREAHARIYLHTECGDFHCGEHECVTWSEDRLADTDIEYVRASAALALPAPTPDAWMLKTGHGVMFAVGKPSSEIDLWTPLYVEPPAPDAVPPLTDDMLRYAMAALGTGSPQEAERFRSFWLHASMAAHKAEPRAPHRERKRIPADEVRSLADELFDYDTCSDANVRRASEMLRALLREREAAGQRNSDDSPRQAPSEIARDWQFRASLLDELSAGSEREREAATAIRHMADAWRAAEQFERVTLHTTDAQFIEQLRYSELAPAIWPPTGPLHGMSAKWVLSFADQDRGCQVFEDETEARDAFLRARVQWTCSLYRLVGRSGCGPELAMYERAEPPAPREPLIELAKRWEQHSEGHAKRSYSAAFSPASAAFTEAARVYEQCATELRMLIADAAPSEIARDAARLCHDLYHGMRTLDGGDAVTYRCEIPRGLLDRLRHAAIEQERNA